MEMSKDPAKYEVLIKQYLRSILAIISNTTKKRRNKTTYDVWKPSMDIVQQRGTRESSPHAETGRTYYSWSATQ